MKKINYLDSIKSPVITEKATSLSDKNKVVFKWVRGHSGHLENERCDTLAVEASTYSDLEIDYVFEKSQEKPPDLFS